MQGKDKAKVIQVHDCTYNYDKEYFHSKQEGIIAEELSISNSFHRSNTKIRILIQNNSIESSSIVFLILIVDEWKFFKFFAFYRCITQL